MVGHPQRRAHALALVVWFALVSSLGAAPAGGAPGVVSDGRSDASPAAFLLRNATNAWAYDAFGAYDVLDGRVLGDTPDLVLFQIHVREIPDAWALLPKIPAGGNHSFGLNASNPTVHLLAFFRVGATDYQADAQLSLYEGEGVVERYLLREHYRNEPVFGSIDAEADTVTLGVPRKLLGAPAAGANVTAIRFEGRIDHHKIDLAPDAVAWDPSNASHSDFGYVVRRLGGTQLVEPTFGPDYVLGSVGNATVPGAIRLTASAVERPIHPGNQTAYDVVVHNLANASDTVSLVLSSAVNASAHAVGRSLLFLAPLENMTVRLNVTLHPDANGSFHTDVNAYSVRGGVAQIAFTTRADPNATLPTVEQPVYELQGPEWQPPVARAADPRDEQEVQVVRRGFLDSDLFFGLELIVLLAVLLLIVYLTRKR